MELSSLSSLPIDVKEQILLQSAPEELSSLCMTSPEFYSICKSSSFWVSKFKEEGLPLLERGDNLRSWLNLYQRALQAEKKTEDKLRDFALLPPRNLLVISSRGPWPSLALSWLGIKTNQEALEAMREFYSLLARKNPPRNKEEEEHLQALSQYSSLIVLKKEPDGEYVLIYSFNTPQTGRVERRMVLTPQLLHGFLFRYYWEL